MINSTKKRKKIIFILSIIFISIVTYSFTQTIQPDKKTYVFSKISEFPYLEHKKTDSLTIKQKKIITKYNLNVHIPDGFLSVVDEYDKEAFVFINNTDSSLMVAKCFTFNDTINKQLISSIKYNSPIYGESYTDLSEFKHFKSCEKLITDTIIGPFYFGGTLYNFLGAKIALHQDFTPKSNKFKFGEFIILIDEDKYLFICSLHNGYTDDMNGNARWNAFSF